MNKAEFITLIENPKSLDKSHITALKNIASDFPYFQASHILLSKALFNENHYEFEKQLRSTAMLVSDREVLYRFLHNLNIDQVVQEPDILRSAEQEKVEIREVIQQEVPLRDSVETLVEDDLPTEALIDHSEKTGISERVVEADQKEIEEIPEVMLQEVVPEKIGETHTEDLPIEALTELGMPETAIEPGTNEIVEEAEVIQQEIAPEEAGETFPEDFPIKELAETGMQETVAETDLNEIVEQVVPIFETEQSTVGNNEPEILHHKNETHSFSEWLMLAGEGRKEEIAEHKIFVENFKKETEHPVENEQIISADPRTVNSNIHEFESILDKFIKENPSISRPKAEFYNPATMANQSNEEDDDLVTETLANIYYKQGAYKKAIRAYEKLCLIYPHKMTFFADLIQRIKEENKKE